MGLQDYQMSMELWVIGVLHLLQALIARGLLRGPLQRLHVLPLCPRAHRMSWPCPACLVTEATRPGRRGSPCPPSPAAQGRRSGCCFSTSTQSWHPLLSRSTQAQRHQTPGASTGARCFLPRNAARRGSVLRARHDDPCHHAPAS